ncbi:GspE/PulE family protein [Sulfurivermis fontis]|uniref:GspE/PulE family protein n=1 Tax=Sulfurivermis fontis TaxID=1972068 RepID=UPI0015588BE1|nr:GspE/PulE family protein [Sulfurivermis fontis]
MKQHVIDNAEDLKKVFVDTRPLSDLHLGEILVDAHHLAEEALEKALTQQRKTPGRRLGDILIEQGLVAKEHIHAAMAHKLGIPFIKLGNFEIDPQILALVPPDIALQYSVLPLMLDGSQLVVAMENPMDWEAMEVLRFNTNHSIEPVVATGQDISEALNRLYRRREDREITDMADVIDMTPEPDKTDDIAIHLIEQEAQKKPIVRLVNAIIMQGILHGASDINIRPERKQVNIYYRVDGKLRFSRSLNKSLLAPLVSRIKITGRMDISERRLPQDGHARLTHNGSSIDLRISCIPTVNGESVVIRILDKQVGLKPLDGLGLGDWELNQIRRMLSRSYGMLLVTGPTGSGKSTTLYAVLNEIRTRDPHIITVEDPVEYDMEGVEQIQINPGTGYTFAEALRHILRHDPDVIMIGEIRDLETARIANKAALTGHLVLSTLHTNDAASTITRLLDMGIEPYLLSSTLLGVMAQRLIRLNCQQCLQEEPVDEEVRNVLQVAADEVFHRGVGCSACNYTGYHGRVAVTELLPITPQISTLINNNACAQAIKDMAIQEGMTTLTQNALALARAGKTSLDEVFAIRLE